MPEQRDLKGLGHNQRTIAQADFSTQPWWTAQEIATKLDLIAHQVTMAMRRLVRMGLFEREQEGPGDKSPYRYRPAVRAWSASSPWVRRPQTPSPRQADVTPTDA